MSTHTTSTSATAWSPDITAFPAGDVIADALVLNHATVLAEVEGDEPALRVAFVDDDEAEIVDEGTAFDEAEPTLTEAVVNTVKVGQLLRVSREQFNQAGTSNELATSVQRSVIKKADQLFIANTSAPEGITQVPGVEDGGEVEDSLDRLVDLVAQVQANGANPSGILLSPKAWARIRQFKTADGSNASLVGAGTDDAEPRLLGLPLTVTAALSNTDGLVVDRNAIVAAAGAVHVARSEHRYFDSDSIGLRASFRFGFNITRPNRIGKFTIADTDGS